MAVQKIRLLGDPVLRADCDAVTRFTGSELRHIATDLADTLGAFRISRGFGRGISAPQIGIPKKVVVINIDGPMLLVNPVIKRRSRAMMTLWDDCFSFPDLMVKVQRNAKITVEYQNFTGAKKAMTVDGDRSELLQHEIDHCNGILAIDRAVDSRHIILRCEWEKMMNSHRLMVAL